MVIRSLRQILRSLIALVSFTVAIFMLFSAYSDRISPVDHPFSVCVGMLFPILAVTNIALLLLCLLFFRRIILIPIIAYLLSIPALKIYIPLNISDEEIPQGIKILSYNVQNFSGKPRYSGAEELIMDYITSCNADIVCLQESHINKEKIARLNNFYAYMDTVYMDKMNGNCLTLYSRYPIIRHERISYTSKSNGSVAYYLKINEDTVLLINNHLEATHIEPYDRSAYKALVKGELDKDSARYESKKLATILSESATIRAPQAEAVHAYIDEKRHKMPVIVCGDFNDSPLSYTRRTIADGLTDCFVSAGFGLGISYNLGGFAFRIDNIMCSNHFTARFCKVDRDIDASDHYPIFCILEKKENE